MLLKTVRIKVWPLWPLGRPFYAWDRISGAGVGALIFTARSAVLESYCYLAQPRMAVLPKAICAAAASVANLGRCVARGKCLGSPAFIGLIALTARAGRPELQTVSGRDAISTRRITKKPMGRMAFAGREDRFYAVSSRRCEKSEKERRQECLRYQERHICDPGVRGCEWCSLRGRASIGRAFSIETPTGGITGAGLYLEPAQ